MNPNSVPIIPRQGSQAQRDHQRKVYTLAKGTQEAIIKTKRSLRQARTPRMKLMLEQKLEKLSKIMQEMEVNSDGLTTRFDAYF